MKNFNFKIIPYSDSYEKDLLELEQKAAQGKFIHLEMIRSNFAKRSEAFDLHQIYLAIDNNGKLMGVLAAAIVTLIQNGVRLNVGYCYDVRVSKNARGLGLTKKMGHFAYQNFWTPNGVKEVFLTMKSSNSAVYKSAKILGLNLCKYPFKYLTIPTNVQIKDQISFNHNGLLNVFAPNKNHSDEYMFSLENGIKIWKTFEFYNIKINKIHPIIKYTIRILNVFRKKGFHFPVEGDELSFATLIFDNHYSLNKLNSALFFLKERDIQYLSIVCSSNTELYRQLKKFAMNSYSYDLLSTFETNPTDYISIDVRCL